MSNESKHQAFLEQLKESFGLEDIKILCFELELIYDDLLGDILSTKTISLLIACHEKDKLQELHGYLIKERSYSEWGEIEELQNFHWGDLYQLQGAGSDLEKLGPTPGEPPYKGLKKFGEEDAEWFFGRDEVINKLIERLHDTNFLIVIGASGSGKSSVVRAGVLPIMRGGVQKEDQAAPPTGDWKILSLTPTAKPLEKLAASLFPQNTETQLAFLKQIKSDSSENMQALVSKVPEIIEAGNKKAEGKKLLLLIDQFEEIFTLCKEKVDQSAFIYNLIEAAEQANTKIVLTMRADFYGNCLEYPELAQLLDKSSYSIGPMNDQELREIIVQPAAKGNWFIQDGLAEEMLKDVSSLKGGLPLLSHALLETWKGRKGRFLTNAGYRATGGVKGAIAKTAQETYDSFSPEEKKIAEKIFLELTELGEGVEDTRRISNKTELVESIVAGEDDVKHVIDQLASDKTRLIVIDEEGAVEVAHEALIRNWPLLRNWIDNNREILRFVRQLQEDAEEWEQLVQEQEGKTGALYRDYKLQRAVEWLNDQPSNNDGLVAQFIKESKKEAEKELRRLQNRTRIAFALAVLGFVLAGFAIFFYGNANANANEAIAARSTAVFNQEQAIVAQGVAEESQQEALLSAETARIEKERADQKSVEADSARAIAEQNEIVADEARAIAVASEQKAEKQAKYTQLQALVRLSTAILPEGRSPSVDELELSLLMAVQGVKLNQDSENKLETFYIDRQARLLADHLIQPTWEEIFKHEAAINSVSFSPAEQLIASGGADGMLALWDLTSKQKGQPMESIVLRKEGDQIESVSFSPSGEVLATGGADGRVRLWPVGRNSDFRPVVIGDHADAVNSVAFSPNSQWLASGSADGIVQLWDLNIFENNREADAYVIETGEEWIRTVAFSSDSLTLATGGADGVIQLWDLSQMGNGVMPDSLEIRGMDEWVFTLAFSPDNRLLAAAGLSGDIYIWELNNSEPDPNTSPFILDAHVDRVLSLDFSSDAKQLASSSWDQTIRLWPIDQLGKDIQSTLLKGEEDWILAVSFSQDDNQLVSGVANGAIQLWDLGESQKRIDLLKGHISDVRTVAISSNGENIASGSYDGSIRLWDVSNKNAPSRVFVDQGNEVLSVAFKPNSDLMVSGDSGGLLQLWIPENQEQNPQSIKGHDDKIWAVVYSPEGTFVASAGLDGMVHLWDSNELISN
ncbi:MAG: WD40 repeat protein, partial [Candidatus Azotimanducaceae bacterium]